VGGGILVHGVGIVHTGAELLLHALLGDEPGHGLLPLLAEQLIAAFAGFAAGAAVVAVLAVYGRLRATATA
jgi:hypothetical protein